MVYLIHLNCLTNEETELEKTNKKIFTRITSQVLVYWLGFRKIFIINLSISDQDTDFLITFIKMIHNFSILFEPNRWTINLQYYEIKNMEVKTLYLKCILKTEHVWFFPNGG